MTNNSLRVITSEETTLYSVVCAECWGVSEDYEHYDGCDPTEEIVSLGIFTTVDEPDTLRFICHDCQDTIFADSDTPESGYRWVSDPSAGYKFYDKQWS